MKYTYLEKLILTKEEVEILDKARILIDYIIADAKPDGEIEYVAKNASDYISDLLSEEFSEME